MRIKSYIWYVIALCVLGFLLHRYLIRPWVLDHVTVGAVIIVVNSFPNLIEAIIGTINLTAIGLLLRKWATGLQHRITDARLYLIVSLVAGLYVISQELNWYNISGHNVYDPFDIIASLIGLILMNRLLNRFGFFIEQEHEEKHPTR